MNQQIKITQSDIRQKVSIVQGEYNQPLKVEQNVAKVYENDYNKVVNKPQINKVELIGNKKGIELGMVDSENYITNQEIFKILNS